MSDIKNRQSVLCIGGPRDGWRVVASPDVLERGRLETHSLDNRAIHRMMEDQADHTVRIHLYRLERFRTGEGLYGVFVHESLTLSNAFEALLTLYPQERP